MPRHREFPLARFFVHESGRKVRSQPPVLCSLGEEVREARRTRRFRVSHWNIHVF
jgi:hypothetical protein